MPSDDETKPRRLPRRGSAHLIVESVLTAASELLLSQALSSITTNDIARRAGVSIGSLYRYFPNKEAVVAALVRDINERIVEELNAVVVNAQGDAQSRLLAGLRVMCSDRVGDVRVRAALLREVPRQWATEMEEAELNVAEIAGGLVRELRPELSDDEVADRKVALMFAVRGAIQGALLYRPGLFEDDKLTHILFRMLVGTEAAEERR